MCPERESSPKPFCSEFGDEHEPETPHMKTPMVTYLPPNTRKREILHITETTQFCSDSFRRTLNHRSIYLTMTGRTVLKAVLNINLPEDYTPASFGHSQRLDVQEVKKKKREVKPCYKD